MTAAYMSALLAPYATERLAGEAFVVLLDLGADDPLAAFPGLPVAGRRRLPATRLRAAGPWSSSARMRLVGAVARRRHRGSGICCASRA